ncbi:MAG: hypothetical protein A2X49_06235 [Lentisphaerae bacterium GWF2_52_8]|nr:MAG: hypothetical protein A2X49_06235 [Lentisphaerae bacterium GWF2_52_8]
MRKVLLLLPLLALFVQGCETKSALPRKIVFSTHPNYPPLMWIKDDSLTGAVPEVSRIIFSSLSLYPEARLYSDWNAVQAAAKNGEIDVISAIYKNDERQSYLLFSDPLVEDPVVVLVKRGRSFPFSRWEDLEAKRGVTPAGESYGVDFDSYMTRLNIKRLSAEDALSSLLKGDADYLVMGLYPAKVLAARTGKKDEVEYLPHPVTSQNFHMAISKKSPFVSLMPKINAKISELRINGNILRLLDKYRIEEYKTINGITD